MDLWIGSIPPAVSRGQLWRLCEDDLGIHPQVIVLKRREVGVCQMPYAVWIVTILLASRLHLGSILLHLDCILESFCLHLGCKC